MSLTSPSTLVDWEYLDSTQNTWTRFSDLAASSALENIFLAGNEPTAIITLNGESMTIDLEKMKFKCLDGNVVIFRRISTKSSSDTIYERQDDHEWVPYDCNTCEMLALAENSGRKSITTFVAGVGSPLIAEYCIDFVGKRQINVDTGRGRNIRIKAPLKSVSETSTKSSRGFLSSIFSFFDSSTRSSPDGGRCVGSGGTLPASGRVSISSTGTSAGTEVTSSNVDKVLAEAVIGECKEETTCCICMGPFDSTSDEDTSYRLKHCPGHAFHDGCIREYFKYKGSCPCCKYPYIITTGDMPDGTMTWQAYPPGGGKSLSGFQGVGTIEIYYDIPSGVQGHIMRTRVRTSLGRGELHICRMIQMGEKYCGCW